MAESPRTALSLAKTRAYNMLRAADQTSKAIKCDKEWEKTQEDLERAKQEKESRRLERVVARQREVRGMPSAFASCPLTVPSDGPWRTACTAGPLTSAAPPPQVARDIAEEARVVQEAEDQEKRDMHARMSESWRSERVVQLSARADAEKSARIYQEHRNEIQRRREKKTQNAIEAEQRLMQHQVSRRALL